MLLGFNNIAARMMAQAMQEQQAMSASYSRFMNYYEAYSRKGMKLLKITDFAGSVSFLIEGPPHIPRVPRKAKHPTT